MESLNDHKPTRAMITTLQTKGLRVEHWYDVAWRSFFFFVYRGEGKARKRSKTQRVHVDDLHQVPELMQAMADKVPNS